MAGRPPLNDNKETKVTKKQPPNLTSDEAAIFQRVQSEQDGWTGITEESMEDFSLMANPFDLPPEAQELFDRKELAFRWAAKTSERIDELRTAAVPMKWWLANATTVPALAKYCDPIHGGIQKLDQILFVKPFWMLQKVRDAKKELADIQTSGGDIKRKHGKPIDGSGSEWRSGEQVKITGDDEIMDPGDALSSVYSSEHDSSSDLTDLVVNE